MKLNNKLMAVAIAALLMAGTTITIACDKEEKTVESTTTSSKSTNPTLIGKLVNGTIICGVDVDSLSAAIWHVTHTYVAEHFEIIDNHTTQLNGQAEAYMVLFNIIEGVPESVWMPIQKRAGDYYFAPGPNDKGKTIICVKELLNRCNKNCFIKRDRDGNFIGCICDGTKGSCKPKIVKDTFLDDIGEALIEIARNIKTNINIILAL